jgi:hypothetical protein
MPLRQTTDIAATDRVSRLDQNFMFTSSLQGI